MTKLERAIAPNVEQTESERFEMPWCVGWNADGVDSIQSLIGCLSIGMSDLTELARLGVELDVENSVPENDFFLLSTDDPDIADLFGFEPVEDLCSDCLEDDEVDHCCDCGRPI